MNILAIGNSFSEDTMRYLHGVAEADGEEIEAVNLFVGGCTLERHHRQMLSDELAYEWQYNGQNTGRFVSLRGGVLDRRWDVVTLQQASHVSFDRASYEPYLSALINFVRERAPDAKIYIHQTWAYENGSARLFDATPYATSEEMLADVVAAYGEMAASVCAHGIIRSGELLGALWAKGMTGLYRDGFHASYGLGRYALGLLWYRTLTGNAVSHNAFCTFDEPLTEAQIRAVQSIVDSVPVGG